MVIVFTPLAKFSIENNLAAPWPPVCWNSCNWSNLRPGAASDWQLGRGTRLLRPEVQHLVVGQQGRVEAVLTAGGAVGVLDPGGRRKAVVIGGVVAARTSAVRSYCCTRRALWPSTSVRSSHWRSKCSASSSANALADSRLRAARRNASSPNKTYCVMANDKRFRTVKVWCSTERSAGGLLSVVDWVRAGANRSAAR